MSDEAEQQLYTLLTITNVLGWTSFVFNTLVFVGYGYDFLIQYFSMLIM